jgi:hypothetical protein
MPKLSRRDFLKQTGVMGAAFGIPTSLPQVPTRPDENLLPLGRVFHLTDVHVRPDVHSQVVGELAPDSVHDITPTKSADWYQVERGYVPRQAVQPIGPYVRPELTHPQSVGFWAELIAPTSTLRAWCAGHAPIVTRLGYGAVVYVMDYLRDDRGAMWYGLAADSDAELVGWTNALHFTEWDENAVSVPLAHEPLIRIDTHQQALQVYDGPRELFRSRLSSPLLSKSQTSITVIQPGGALGGIDSNDSIEADGLLGVSWLMSLGQSTPIYGAYWHSRFGDAVTQVKNRIELPIFAARWLYGFIIKNSQPPPLVEVC